jgi:hypothetical protein
MLFVSSRIWLINIVLTVLVVFFGILSVDVWTGNGPAVHDRSEAADAKAHPPVKKVVNRITPPAANYDIVAEKNLFSPDRMSSTTGASDQPQPQISGHKIFLYGVVQMAGQKQALINHPIPGEVPGARGQTEDQWVKTGDRIGNLKVAQIGEEKIVMVEDGQRYEIFLHDENKPARRQNPVTRPPAAPTVVVTGAEPKAPAPAAAGNAVPPPSQPASAPEPAAAKEEKKKQVTEDGYEIVETPFGPFKRRIK